MLKSNFATPVFPLHPFSTLEFFAKELEKVLRPVSLREVLAQVLLAAEGPLAPAGGTTHQQGACWKDQLDADFLSPGQARKVLFQTAIRQERPQKITLTRFVSQTFFKRENPG